MSFKEVLDLPYDMMTDYIHSGAWNERRKKLDEKVKVKADFENLGLSIKNSIDSLVSGIGKFMRVRR